MGWRNIRRRLSLRLRTLRSCAAGAAAAEFAIIVPVIGVLLAGTIDLAQFANAGLVLDGALRAGAAYALKDPTNQTAIKCIIGDPSVTCPSGLSRYTTFSTGATVTVTFLTQDVFAATDPQYCTWDDGTTVVSCNNSVDLCAGARCPKHFYIKIQAVESGLSPTMQLTGMPTSVTRTLTVRVQ
jgi:Flp pilus assembly protein TadG